MDSFDAVYMMMYNVIWWIEDVLPEKVLPVSALNLASFKDSGQGEQGWCLLK